MSPCRPLLPPRSGRSRTTYHVPRTTYHVPRTTYHVPRTTYHVPVPRTTYHVPRSMHDVPVSHSRCDTPKRVSFCRKVSHSPMKSPPPRSEECYTPEMCNILSQSVTFTYEAYSSLSARSVLSPNATHSNPQLENPQCSWKIELPLTREYTPSLAFIQLRHGVFPACTTF